MALIPLGGFLEAAIAPLARRVLAALGLGIISYAVVTTILAAVILAAKAHYNSIPAMALSIAGLGGVGEGLGIVVGAVVFRAALTHMSKIGKLPS